MIPATNEGCCWAFIMSRLSQGLSWLFAALLASSSAAGADAKQCTQEEAMAAETEAEGLKTWPEIFQSFRRYAHCDDAAISEGYSASVATLIADRWDLILQLNALAGAHPAFRAFVLRHLDETMNADQVVTIRENAQGHCPKGAKALCSAIYARLTEP